MIQRVIDSVFFFFFKDNNSCHFWNTCHILTCNRYAWVPQMLVGLAFENTGTKTTIFLGTLYE